MIHSVFVVCVMVVGVCMYIHADDEDDDDGGGG